MYLATIHVLIDDTDGHGTPIDVPGAAADFMSELLRAEPGILDWSYVQASDGTFTEPVEVQIDQNNYEEGSFLSTCNLVSEPHINLTWSIDDFSEIRPDLTPEQCYEVLLDVEHSHDATLGVTWDTLQDAADGLFPKGDDEPEEDED